MEIKTEENMEQFQDRIRDYLMPHLNDYLFDELSPEYMKRAGVSDILTGVPVPINKNELEGLSTLKIAKNMAMVIGCDINFKYRENYIAYILRTFTKEFAKPLINEGIDGAAKNDFDFACICFRGAIMIDPESTDALYCYGRACKDSYENGEGEEYVGRYKAESLEAFEKLTLKKPDFDMGFYFLGYGYLNLGLYIKAKLTWDKFMELSNSEQEKEEVSKWLEKLRDPVIIEEGYNAVLSGRFETGIEILSQYEDDSRFNTWWPLWHYLGKAYKELGELDNAKDCFNKVLKLSPSNIETMAELMEIFQIKEDYAMTEKYANKIEIVKANIEKDKLEKGGQLS